MSSPDKSQNSADVSDVKKPEIIDTGRRTTMSNLLKLGAVVGTMKPLKILAAITPTTEQKPDEGGIGFHDVKEQPEVLPYQQEELSDIKAKETDKTEVELMDTAMNSLFRHYLQPSFFLHALPIGVRDEIMETIEKAIKQYKELSYHLTGDGYLEITKRKTKKPSENIPDNFKIIIRNGVITKVNGYSVNLRALENWDAEWKYVQEKIEEVNPKIQALVINGEIIGGDATKSDDKWFEFCSYRLPFKFRELLKLKQKAFGKGYNKTEEDILEKLNIILKNHPNDAKEAKEKKSQLYVTRASKDKPNPTPDFMVELIYAFNVPHETETFAAFDFNGNVMTLQPASQPAAQPTTEPQKTKTESSQSADKSADTSENQPKGKRGGKGKKTKPEKDQAAAQPEQKVDQPTNVSEVKPLVWRKSSPSFADLYRAQHPKK